MNNTITSTALGSERDQKLAAGQKLRKLIVAVHGIGKQSRYATIQCVASRFGTYCKCSGALPLGSFHPEGKHEVTALRNPSPPYPRDYPEALHDVGFSEIFWANIPHEAVTAADTLEETKAWAKSVVERVRALDLQKNKHESVDYEKTSTVIAEMIDTIGVLEKLLSLTSKCGLGTFDLQKVLTEYVGDIQVVTEFANYRTRIFEQFHKVLRELNQRHAPDEIHIVAHSEGTVIAFLGLLQAMSRTAPTGSEWADKVVGFMTLGSPIDKHLVMWPKLWAGLEPAPASLRNRTCPIDWRNYYDFGDPVGFELDTARDWLIKGGWMSQHPAAGDLFKFPGEAAHDHGFSRYLLPGKAHNDYWEDEELFRHFFANVVERSDTKPRPRLPRDLGLARLVSRIVPYLICFTILLVGAYVLYKPVSQFVNAEQGPDVIAWNVFAVASILGGMTVLARVPRLARSIWNYAAAIVTFVISALIYRWAIDADANMLLGLFFEQRFGWAAETAIVWVLGVVGLGGGIISYVYPRSGLKGIVVLVGLVSLAVLWGVVTGPGKLPGSAERPAIWPVALGAGVFLYCWWLAALVFDLAFVWHRYIRSSRAMKFLRTCGVNSAEVANVEKFVPDVAGAGLGGRI